MPKLLEAKYLRPYVLWVRWSDGREGEVDLADELHGSVFEPLKDVAYFRAFILSPATRTVVWPNGADIAPELMYERTRAAA